MVIHKSQEKVSFFVYVFFILIIHKVQADDGFAKGKNWGHQLYTQNNQLQSGISSYKDPEDVNKWVLDEEHILTSKSKIPHQATQLNMQSELWWKVTSQDDPAMNAEPVSWDGVGLVNSVSPNLFLDYELIQDMWKEDAVT